MYVLITRTEIKEDLKHNLGVPQDKQVEKIIREQLAPKLSKAIEESCKKTNLKVSCETIVRWEK